MEKPFNATFFATVAVVQPVLFLAIALQSDYLARTFVMVRRIQQHSQSRFAADLERKAMLRSIGSYSFGIVGAFLAAVGALVFIFAILGEILSLRALEQQQASLHSQALVMNSVIALVIAAAAASLWRIVEAIVLAERQAMKERQSLVQDQGDTSIQDEESDSAL